MALNCFVFRTLTEALEGDTVTVTGKFTTSTVTAFETPPSGFITVTGMPEPVEEADPDALSWIGETKAVANAAPPSLTTAPF